MLSQGSSPGGAIQNWVHRRDLVIVTVVVIAIEVFVHSAQLAVCVLNGLQPLFLALIGKKVPKFKFVQKLTVLDSGRYKATALCKP